MTHRLSKAQLDQRKKRRARMKTIRQQAKKEVRDVIRRTA